MREGLVAVAPLLLGIIPFGMVAGAAAVDAGLGLGGAVGLSVFVFAGASQLAAIELLGDAAPTAVIVLTIMVINLRFAMYSAAVAPLVPDVTRGRRVLMSYLLVDQAFALTLARHAVDPKARNPFGFFVGCAVTLWTAWQATTILGAIVGSTLPDWLPLGAAIPLMFLVILIPTVTDRATLSAAVASGAVATLAVGLPYNAGLLLAAVTGIAVGTVVAERSTVAVLRAPVEP
ncbi:MAG: putative branched-subunit amino acid permease [Myxococcota bacterium]|jgi:predicted branched-subunit amino acid permease